MLFTYVTRLDDRRVKADKTYPLKVWVVYNGTGKPYSTIFSLTENDFDKLSAKNLGGELREIRDQVRQLEADLDAYRKEISEFSFERFEIAFVARNKTLVHRKVRKTASVELPDNFDAAKYEKRFRILKEEGGSKGNLLGCYMKYIITLLRGKQLKTACVNQSSFYSLFRFRGNIPLSQITKQYLKDYDLWMREQGKSKTSIGIWVRVLRKIINEAIEDGIFPQSDYPFGEKKYVIPAGTNNKRALDSACVQDLFKYEPSKEREAFARDTWLFLYFGNGMNPKDMCKLRYENYVDGYIEFERSKTELNDSL